MFSYSNPEFVDAQVRYRREQISRDWSGRASQARTGSYAHLARHALLAVATLGTTARHHRHA